MNSNFLFKPNSSGSGTSTDATNLITNPDFSEANVSFWSLGTATLTSSFPSGVPTFGSGASGNLTLSYTTTNPLNGSGSMSYASSAATTAGNFVATNAITISLVNQARVLQFKFAYKADTNPANGNFSGTSSNSFGVAFYDVTNSAWVQPAGVFNIVQNSGVGICTGTVQTASNITSLRMVIYNANASSGAITMYFDDFYLGQQIIPQGAAVSDWISYTPTILGFGTPSNVLFFWRRVGDSMDIRGYFTSGTSTAVTATINLPNSRVVSTTKLPSGFYTVQGVGALSTTGDVIINQTFGGSSLITFGRQGASSTGLNQFNGNQVATSTQNVTLELNGIAIDGWSSNTSLSNDTDTRVVAARYTSTATTTYSSSYADVVYATKDFDTHSAFDGTTYTVPASGVYKIDASIAFAIGTNQGTIRLGVVKNSTRLSTALIEKGGTVNALSGAIVSAIVSCNAGDALKINLFQDMVASLALQGDATFQWVNFNRLSGPATIAASESVNARYFASSTSISGSLNTVVWTTKDFDSHNAMNSGLYTIPVSGKYQVNTGIATSGTFALNNSTVIEIQKNSTAISNETMFAAGVITAGGAYLSDTISCNAGDVLRVQVSCGATSPTITSSNTRNFISISRVGN